MQKLFLCLLLLDVVIIFTELGECCGTRASQTLLVGLCMFYIASSRCTFTLTHGRRSLFSYLKRSIHFTRRVTSPFVTPYRAVQLTTSLVLNIMSIAFLVVTQLTTTTSVHRHYSLRTIKLDVTKANIRMCAWHI